MIVHLTPKERMAYAALAVLFLFAAGYVGAKQIRQHDTVTINEGTKAPRSPDPVPPTETRHAGPVPETETQRADTGPAVPSAVVVDVAGEVRTPGVYKLPAGARVTDAIEAAGGFSPDADSDHVNLAAKVLDGSQILIPKVGAVPAEAAASVGTAPPPAPDSSGVPTKGGKHPAGPVSLSTATQEELQTIPGIGPSTAERIIAYREAHNGFHSVDELTAVGGIGPKKLAKMRQWLVP